MLFGLSDLAAKVDKGVYDRGQPLVQLGLVICFSFKLDLLPGLTKYFMKKTVNNFYKLQNLFALPQPWHRRLRLV